MDALFDKYYLYNSDNLKIRVCLKRCVHIVLFLRLTKIGNLNVYRFGKRRTPTNYDNWLNKTSEIMDMRSISIKKHEMEIR